MIEYGLVYSMISLKKRVL